MAIVFRPINLCSFNVLKISGHKNYKSRLHVNHIYNPQTIIILGMSCCAEHAQKKEKQQGVFFMITVISGSWGHC